MTAAREQPVVLVVEDDHDVRRLIVDLLEDEGVRAHEAQDGASALQLIGDRSFDVVLLDIMLPSMNGLELLSEIRKRSDVPIMFVTGRGDETDRVLGLRMGADDYIVKPFSGPELAARVHSLLRRIQPRDRSVPVMHFGELTIDPRSRDVSLDGTVVELTAREFDLLCFLASAPRQVFTREQLLSQVWASSVEWQDSATVTEHVRRIRRKIEKDPDDPRWVRTVRGVGYRFEP